MHFSSRTDYALRTLLDLAQHQEEGIVPTCVIARRQEIPPKFLEQILMQLKAGGLVKSKRGPRGGYCLCRSPADITLAEVVRLVEGVAAPAPDATPGPRRAAPFAAVWLELEGLVQGRLEKISMQDMLDRSLEPLDDRASAYVI